MLVLDDFDAAGQVVDVLALLAANLSQANRLFIGPDRGGSDVPIDGELGISPSQTLISRISWIGAVIALNDNDDPQSLSLSNWFGASNTVSEWTLTIQTDEGTASTNQLSTTGSNFARFDFTQHPNIGIINNIAIGTRFLLGLTRTVLATQTVGSMARPSTALTAIAPGAGRCNRRCQAQTVGAVASLSQPIPARVFPAQTITAAVRIAEPTLTQQTPTATPDPQTLEALAVLPAPTLQSVAPVAMADARAVAASAQLNSPALTQAEPTGTIQGRTLRVSASLSQPTVQQQTPVVALAARTISAAAAIPAPTLLQYPPVEMAVHTLTAVASIPTPTLQQQQIGSVTLTGQTVDAAAALSAPTMRTIPPGDVEMDGRTLVASARLVNLPLTQTIPTGTLQVRRHFQHRAVSSNLSCAIFRSLSHWLGKQYWPLRRYPSRPLLPLARVRWRPLRRHYQPPRRYPVLRLRSYTHRFHSVRRRLQPSARITAPAVRQIPPGVGAAGQTVAAAALVRQPTLRQVPPPDVASAQTLAAAARLRRPRVDQIGLASTLQSQTLAATASVCLNLQYSIRGRR